MDTVEWTPEAWTAALAAMREASSTAAILALYEGGAITSVEVLGGAWEQCHDRPSLRAELVRQFREYPDDYIADMVGGGLEELAAQAAERAAQRR